MLCKMAEKIVDETQMKAGDDITENSNDDSSWTLSDDDEEDHSDPEVMLKNLLDLRSPNFNSKLFLTVSDTKLPVKNVPKFKSLAEFTKKVPDLTVMPKRIKKRNKESPVKIVPSESQSQPAAAVPSSSTHSTPVPSSSTHSTATACSEEVFYPIPGRKFLPHQLPVYRPRKDKPNVITLMDAYEGPCAALNKARTRRTIIKVWTRNHFGIRGYIRGYLEAFDKHWNLVISRVEEIFQRKRAFKTPPVISPADMKEERESFKSGEYLRAYSSHNTRSAERQTGKEHFSSSSSYSSHKKTKKDLKKIEKSLKTLRLADDFKEGTLLTLRHGLTTFLPKSRRLNEVKHLTYDSNCTSNSELRKKRFVILNQPIIDYHGDTVLAQSQKYEIVHRRFKQIFLLGDDIIFIETGYYD